MSYQPAYHYLPPLGPSWLTPFYDIVCSLGGLGKSFKRLVLRAVPISDGETVVDIGCATGVLLKLAKKQYPHSRVIGIDPDAGALAIARRRLKRAGLAIEFQQAFAESLPLADTAVDICFSTLVFHHLPDEAKRQAISEIYRVLTPGGRIVLADFGPSSSRWLKKFLFFEKMEYLQGNLNGIIPQFITAAGFHNLEAAGRKFPGITVFTARKI